MRVIAGSARRLQLKTVEGLDTRPTTDRIKETLFNMLADEIYDCEFLDLFAGSGAIGIEALSRGAAHAVFVEKNMKATDCVKYNLNHTKLIDKATIMKMDAITALHNMEGRQVFDIIFMDPPYNHQFEQQILEYLSHSAITAEKCLIIFEASLDTEFDYIEQLGYRLLKEKKYKTNKHVFLEKE